MIKPQFVDFLTQDDFTGTSRGQQPDEEKTVADFPGKNINVQVDENLLLGIMNFKQTDAKQLKEMGTKTQM